MRITYRRRNNKEYWAKRWEDIPADPPMTNTNAYPLKYAELTINSKKGKILEAGCGAGRLLRYYKENGYDIIGMDFIETAINKLKAVDPTLKVETGDITNLKYEDHSFEYMLSFGLYHNLPDGKLQEAIKETYRVLEHGGKVCASFRADNIQTRLTDWLTEYRATKEQPSDGVKEFHKMNLSGAEFKKFFENEGFVVEKVYPVENMPILYKFSLFRSALHKKFNENLARKEGYRLSFMGHLFQNFLINCFPNQFCNIFVLIAKKS
jgi:SAM-dependent methyltransferase